MTATVDINYTNIVTPETVTIGPYASRAVLNGNSIAPGYVGSAKICGRDEMDQLLVVVNQLRPDGYGDWFNTYNGFNLQPEPTPEP